VFVRAGGMAARLESGGMLEIRHGLRNRVDGLDRVAARSNVVIGGDEEKSRPAVAAGDDARQRVHAGRHPFALDCSRRTARHVLSRNSTK